MNDGIKAIEHDGIMVVRDDLFLGGTKARVIHNLFTDDVDEYVYASPVQGFAQVALAIAARKHGKRATIFCAGRAKEHARTTQVREVGAKVITVRPGYLSNVQYKASDYCRYNGAILLPWGLDCPTMIEAIVGLARGLRMEPTQVWAVAGSGTLVRALGIVWPMAELFAVRVGATPNAGRATVLTAPERFEHGAKVPPPFPSCSNYDAKLWRYRPMMKPGALLWNVAGEELIQEG